MRGERGAVAIDCGAPRNGAGHSAIRFNKISYLAYGSNDYFCEPASKELQNFSHGSHGLAWIFLLPKLFKISGEYVSLAAQCVVLRGIVVG